MHYADLQALKPERFKRLTGVSPQTFNEMLATLKESWRDFGRPCKLSREDQLLVALMYWREYRSLAHIGATYKISEPTVSRTIRRVEDTLMQSGKFTLPGKN
ncbi:MAG: transposase family protein [Armatimonadota bacterium]